MKRIRRWIGFCFSTPSHASATATFVIAIVTTVYAVVSYCQWTAMKMANDINAQNIYEIQRPFITIARMAAMPIYINGLLTGARLNPIVENAGNTPAKDFVLHINYDTVVDPIPNDYGFPDIDSVVRYPAVAGPRSIIPVPDKFFLISRIIKYQSKAKYLYIYGRATYNDRFQKTPDHVTLFCFRISEVVGNLSAAGGTIGIQIPACERHNCTDEECREQGFLK
jgi:hypothetical protein